MHVIPVKWRRASAMLLRGLAAPALLVSGGLVMAAEPAAPPANLPPTVAATPAPAHAQVVVPDVATARSLAVEHQPAVQAARASLAAAQTRRASLDKLFLAGVLARDLKIRKEQSDCGVTAAAAAEHQAEADAIYAASYCFLAYEYASMQDSIAAEAVERVEVLRQVIKDTLEKRKRADVFEEHLNLATAVSTVVQGRAAEAKAGKKRALAALHEALGLPTDTEIVVPDRALPEVRAELTRDAIVAAALARRGEVTQAECAAEVAHLEVEAQRKTFMPTARTFASGSDIHYVPIPTANLGIDYRPGGIGLEMPGMLAGPRGCRAEQATELAARASAVVDKTRGLIALEAEDAFLKWEETAIVAHRLASATKDADKYYDKLQSRFQIDPEKKGIDNPTIEDLVNAGAVIGKIKADVNEAHFKHLAALAVLERATGGGVCVNFDQPPPKNGNGK